MDSHNLTLFCDDESFFRFIDLTELKEALDLAGFKVPGWRVRDMIDRYDRTDKPGNQIVGQRKLSYGEFEHVSTTSTSAI